MPTRLNSVEAKSCTELLTELHMVVRTHGRLSGVAQRIVLSRMDVFGRAEDIHTLGQQHDQGGKFLAATSRSTLTGAP